MVKYYIDYHNDVGNVCKDFPSLAAAMQFVEENATCTQEDVDIYEDGRLVAVLPWVNIPVNCA